MPASRSSKRRACAYAATSLIFRVLARSSAAQAAGQKPQMECERASAPMPGCWLKAIAAQVACLRAEQRCLTRRRRVRIASRRLRIPRLYLQSGLLRRSFLCRIRLRTHFRHRDGAGRNRRRQSLLRRQSCSRSRRRRSRLRRRLWSRHHRRSPRPKLLCGRNRRRRFLPPKQLTVSNASFPSLRSFSVRLWLWQQDLNMGRALSSRC